MGVKKRKATGYDEEQTKTGLLYKEDTDIAFFESTEPLKFLHENSKINLSEEHKENENYLEEIKISCEDLKVLDKREIKNLLKWRLKMREELGMEEEDEKMEDD